MTYGRRCGCWTLSELEAERSRHRTTLEQNTRLTSEIQTLRDELLLVHDSVTQLERRYADLSGRYREAREQLNQATSSTNELRGQSDEAAEDNRRLRAICRQLEDQVARLRGEVEGATKAAEEERLVRLRCEEDLTREVEAVERSCRAELRRAASTHSLDLQQLQQEVARLDDELLRERGQHSTTKRRLQHLHHLLGVHHHHHRRHLHHHSPLLPRSRSLSPYLCDDVCVP
ncbi:leucine-rich repeat-containing protein 45 [Hyalella azteca]|uniref:Leucine-rich repeat-containing protein 45 n=1 Tax=Hyalella azteca TaxID=294128 RepID=A0A8B7PDG2_HYAAZ|nr:leucine-rich repeat-containing protein 45 [Hyalella azteca]